MKAKQLAVAVIAAGMMAGVNPATAGEQDATSFAALSQVEAQSLSAGEMKSISGELTTADIIAALDKVATADPCLAPAVTKVETVLNKYSVQINAFLARFTK